MSCSQGLHPERVRCRGPLRCIGPLSALRRGREAVYILRHHLEPIERDADLAEWPRLGRAKIALALRPRWV
ncbi:hypothetical protein [Coriobacterium glomerans]|uniref:hypothetical protein n=1 Tax=Coriobacterium glomerans TaxID=33871 RepID=UPI00031F07A9|nr:hypothetical protein [Coriobacterium glomerans]